MDRGSKEATMVSHRRESGPVNRIRALTEEEEEVAIEIERAAPPIRLRRTPAEQGYALMRAGYTALPLIAGIDKFFNALGDWEEYLAPQVLERSPFRSKRDFMRMVGVTEIAAGVLVGARPRIGGLVVGAWLCGIVANLVMKRGHYDVALRDIGLAIGAISLSRLAASA
jgi:hypothetical protein